MRIWLRSHLWEEQVLIESDWNLKLSLAIMPSCSMAVLIESDWNLKFILTLTSDDLA